MKSAPSSSRIADPRWIDESHPELRTLWFADGTSLAAKVTKVDGNGIQIASPEKNGFINATELSTADRVHYRFGSRAEDAWVARVNAIEAKHKLARP